jgi:hypothetical protein
VNGAPAAVARLAVGAGAIAGLVRAAFALATSVAGELGMASPLRIALLPLALVGVGTGLALRVRRTRVARLVPLLVATAGAVAGVAWAGVTRPDGAAACAVFLLAATFFAVGPGSPDLDGDVGARRVPRPPPAARDEEPPLLG